MLNYENRLVVVTYCIEFEGLIQLDVESPIINKEISVALAALVFTIFTHNEIFSVVRLHFLCSYKRNIKHLLIQLIQLIQLSIY